MKSEIRELFSSITELGKRLERVLNFDKKLRVVELSLKNLENKSTMTSPPEDGATSYILQDTMQRIELLRQATAILDLEIDELDTRLTTIETLLDEQSS